MLKNKQQQLIFWECEGKFYIPKTCKECKWSCKVHCFSPNVDLFCKKYRKDNNNNGTKKGNYES